MLGVLIIMAMVAVYVFGWYILGITYEPEIWAKKRERYYKKYHHSPWW